ncbi:N-acetylmuramoyl-L-alanine amidase [Halioxenophilus sp. WMMB6]|uniref:N-acetylmuramoyl-L-alanine amidase n=1 Tax=Halioxenophilus sp. WMMB6 TaxID=3073815 RepID=UPI00295ED420|nr:N-acetylmuramoyl-L-alanine amidase [Halioxenophilus sp. WMMB6]
MAQLQEKLKKVSALLLLLSGMVILPLAFSLPANAASMVEGFRLWRAPESTRLVLDLSQPIQYNLFTLDSPARIVIDIDNAAMAQGVGSDDLVLQGTPISIIRTATRDKSNLRVVLELDKSLPHRTFSLRSQGDKPNRLVLDIFDQEQSTVKTERTQTDAKDDSRRDIIVVIDAGHGGQDPGAIGSRNLREKDVVLAISKHLAELINREPGYKALLTRSKDFYIPLTERSQFARDKRADLFVSIHADAFDKAQANGASVFALSHKGATSETARLLAQKENQADLIAGVGHIALDEINPEVKPVVLDLYMKATLRSSLEVGSSVLKNLDSVADLHKHKVEQANFVVLKSPDVPSILVETGFISNPGEAKKLGTDRYRRQLASQIFLGLKSYFYEVPPVGSYVAWQKQGGGDLEYTVATGDTLTDIAKRHATSVSAIRRHNGLQSDKIRVGQRIKIPTS